MPTNYNKEGVFDDKVNEFKRDINKHEFANFADSNKQEMLKLLDKTADNSLLEVAKATYFNIKNKPEDNHEEQ